MKVRRIDQVAIAVGDLEGAIGLFSRLFGLEPTDREVGERDGVDEITLDVDGCKLQLLGPTRPSSPIARSLERRGPGLHHIALEVDDLEAMLEHLRRQGVRLIDEAPRPGGGGAMVAFVHPASTFGTLIELVQGSSLTHETPAEE